MLTTYQVTIGDGHHPAKDGTMTLTVTASWEIDNLDTLLRTLVIARFPYLDREIDAAWCDDNAAGDGVCLYIDESPMGEDDGYAGPWLTASLRRLEADTSQLDFAALEQQAA